MEQSINLHSANYLSSLPIANSEIQKRIIELGRVIVRELKLDPGVDTLSRWMAHYIAELIETAENPSGDNRAEIEEKCFKTILQLWAHRSSLPNGKRPFENYEPIFQALERLSPEHHQSYFFNYPQPKSANINDIVKTESDQVQKWIDIAFNIDRVARLFISYSLKKASLNATDEKTVSWLDKSTGFLDDGGRELVVRIINNNREDNKADEQEKILQEQERIIQNRLELLETFVQFSSSLREELSADLDELAKRRNSKTED